MAHYDIPNINLDFLIFLSFEWHMQDYESITIHVLLMCSFDTLINFMLFIILLGTREYVICTFVFKIQVNTSSLVVTHIVHESPLEKNISKWKFYNDLISKIIGHVLSIELNLIPFSIFCLLTYTHSVPKLLSVFLTSARLRSVDHWPTR